MQLKRIELLGFKSFAKKTTLDFTSPVTAIVGPNGSGKSNVVEAIRFVLGEQSMKSLRGKGGADLIFKGSKLLPSLNRASVAITFDNTARAFSFTGGNAASMNLDFDEVVVKREVAADGANKYSINGTDVRLKDVLELVASVNIGSSGHHIISQGEADRLLSSSAKDRRAMVEDALGLKVYQYRIRESERKLEKTSENMKEVQSLRREIAPHISFLKKQVEKIEKARELREELQGLYLSYFAKEAAYITRESETLAKNEESLRTTLASVEAQLAQTNTHTDTPATSYDAERASLDRDYYDIQKQKDELSRKLGRMEGALEAMMREVQSATPVKGNNLVPLADIVAFKETCDSLLTSVRESNDPQILRTALLAFEKSLQDFVVKYDAPRSAVPEHDSRDAEKTELRALIKEVESSIEVLRVKEHEITEKRAEIRERETKSQEHRIEAERELYELRSKKTELLARQNVLAFERDALAKIEADFTQEIQEASVLVGTIALHFEKGVVLTDAKEMIRSAQEDARRKIERIKIKIEDSGAIGGGDVLKEYEETTARDAFLVRELDDLTKSQGELRSLITELKTTLDTSFKTGVEKINTQFQTFFSTMFGGGTAFLSIVVLHKLPDRDEEEERKGDEELAFERGLEINVSLPHKKVRDLNMLSGGERSLTSIALLFAMSQVNPPPFLVLDETDAALDEANSRKYGAMITTLSSASQLILVTHNRETMSRAQVLYGVTIGADGGSKLLSIKLEEAVQIAK